MVCAKCGGDENAVYKGVRLCRTCFASAVENRIGKEFLAKELKTFGLCHYGQADEIHVLAHSGSAKCATLMEMLNGSLKRRCVNALKVVHVRHSVGEDLAAMEAFGKSVQAHGLRLDVVEEHLALQSTQILNKGIDTNSIQAETPSQKTAQASLRQSLLISSLIRYCESQHATQIINLYLGTSATSLAIQTLCNISTGAAYNQAFLSTHGCFISNRVRLFLPLREISDKDLALLCYFRNQQHFLISLPPAASVQSTTRDLILSLEQNFPSTASSVTKTAAKFELPPLGELRCGICSLPCKDGDQEWLRRTSERQTALKNTHRDMCYACALAWTEAGPPSISQYLLANT